MECADVCFTSLRIHLKVIYLNTCTENFNVLVLTTFTIEVSLCMVNDSKIKWFSVYGPNILKNSLLMLRLADLKTSLCATDKEPLISKDCDLVVLCILVISILTDDQIHVCIVLSSCC